ncbi:hypothetical protein EMPG_12233 [Blastomyces silverae]|uniref:Uncharacterized protein n=1 Tax=Blastomyces silverae TaxID=2060906 RepID=A0A0H1BNU4_9EURO|nr:hypothetical protein EMPG_12233 [Blastomyces silverae]
MVKAMRHRNTKLDPCRWIFFFSFSVARSVALKVPYAHPQACVQKAQGVVLARYPPFGLCWFGAPCY